MLNKDVRKDDFDFLQRKKQKILGKYKNKFSKNEFILSIRTYGGNFKEGYTFFPSFSLSFSMWKGFVIDGRDNEFSSYRK